jgi:hypothetical protein
MEKKHGGDKITTSEEAIKSSFDDYNTCALEFQLGFK